jgi:hypothetical protein
MSDDDIRSLMVTTMARDLARRLDDLIRKAIGERLGVSEFQIETLRGRLTRIPPRLGDSSTTYCLDGKPILQTFPGEDDPLADPPNAIRAGFRYRLFPSTSTS